MRVHHLTNGPAIFLSNEEKDFIDTKPAEINLESLKEREYVLAQNLVRKGVYEISKNMLHLNDGKSPKKLS